MNAVDYTYAPGAEPKRPSAQWLNDYDTYCALWARFRMLHEEVRWRRSPARIRDAIESRATNFPDYRAAKEQLRQLETKLAAAQQEEAAAKAIVDPKQRAADLQAAQAKVGKITKLIDKRTKRRDAALEPPMRVFFESLEAELLRAVYAWERLDDVIEKLSETPHVTAHLARADTPASHYRNILYGTIY